MKEEPLSLHEQYELLDRMRQELGQERMEAVNDMPLRQAMITEYKIMASTSLQLLNMLERTGFVRTLSEEDHARYQELMAQLAESSNQCVEFVERSRSLDRDNLLAALPLQHGRAN